MQGKRILVAAVSGLMALSIATPALAIMSVPNGWFLEANVGSTNLSNVSYNGSSSSSGVGGNGNLGYKFMPYVAAEMGYSQYANTSIDNAFGTRVATVKFYSYDLALRGILPMSDTGFELFAKLGAQRLNAKTTYDSTPQIAQLAGISNGSHSVTGLYWGIGAQYYWWPEVAINAQWQTAQGNSTTGTMSLLTGGISIIID